MSGVFPLPAPARRSPRSPPVNPCECCSLYALSPHEALQLAEDLRSTALQIEACVRPLVEPYGLGNKAYEVLACLSQAGGTLTLKDLVVHARLDRAKQTRLLDQMEASGWLHRIRSPRDRRTATIQLLPQGQQLMTDMAQTMKRFPMRQTRWPLPASQVCLMGRGPPGGGPRRHTPPSDGQ